MNIYIDIKKRKRKKEKTKKNYKFIKNIQFKTVMKTNHQKLERIVHDYASKTIAFYFYCGNSFIFITKTSRKTEVEIHEKLYGNFSFFFFSNILKIKIEIIL